MTSSTPSPSARWTLGDNTSARGGYMELLLDGQSVCIDVFPFKRGADPQAVRQMAQRICDVLNAAEWSDD